ncbi:MAG: YfhO family protein [Alloprevotella sp.]|nr:YfhO family protein [Alloprevotella sp.]
MNFLKRFAPDVVAVLLLLLLAFAYFASPTAEGLVLGGHDAVASVGQGREQLEFYAQTGERTRWTNTLFSGMPTYQIAPSYKSSALLNAVAQVYGLGITNAISHVFLLLLGFYLLMRAFGLRPWLSALGAGLWAFSSYFFIIIAAGHIWKVTTLAFIPPTIAGVVLCYRGRLLLGGAVTALFTAFQILSNHVQMSYYFLPLMLFVVLAYGVEAARGGALARWARATGVVLVAGLLGVAANLPNLYHTYEYSKLSMRGPSELTPTATEAAQATDGGLDRDYITMWSYGINESLTFLVPDFKGGGSGSVMARGDVQEMEEYDTFSQCIYAADAYMRENGVQAVPPGLSQYWGEQPFTVGPVYVGALVCLLFLFGLFFVRGPLKWALLAATVLSFLMGWGHNDAWFTNFCIDHLPMYNKFRTPSSALVVAEFTMPLLAVLCLARIIREPQAVLGTLRGRLGLGVSLALTAGLCLLLWLAPGVAGDCLTQAERQLLHESLLPAGTDFVSAYSGSVSAIRHHILAASAGRSLLVILFGAALIAAYLYAQRKQHGGLLPQLALCGALAVLCLADMWQVNKLYLNDESFTDPVALQNPQPTAADQLVLQDKADYRVLSVAEGSPFNETSNHTAYFHQSIGGYNAAKLHRYQDLIDRRLGPEMQTLFGYVNDAQGDMAQVPGDSLSPAINMLNAKYFIFGSRAEQVVLNPYANGNGWFVSQLRFVKDADAEMQALQAGLDTKREAVADEAFRSVLDGSPLDSGTVRLLQREANRLQYEITSPRGGVAVLSEVYYPGWTATIDGQPAEIGRVNYILRALKVPAGAHAVTLEYRPATVRTTETVAFIAIALIFLALIAAAFMQWRRRKP